MLQDLIDKARKRKNKLSRSLDTEIDKATIAVEATQDYQTFARMAAHDTEQEFKVISGYFAGMELQRDCVRHSQVDNLAGLYEPKVHDVLEEWFSDRGEQAVFVDIGCADGYYAVGAALKGVSRVYAYDISPMFRERCAALAKINGVEKRLDIRSQCTSSELIEIFSDNEDVIVLCDIEGFEYELLTKEIFETPHVSFVIEVHPGRATKEERSAFWLDLETSGRSLRLLHEDPMADKAKLVAMRPELDALPDEARQTILTKRRQPCMWLVIDRMDQ